MVFPHKVIIAAEAHDFFVRFNHAAQLDAEQLQCQWLVFAIILVLRSHDIIFDEVSNTGSERSISIESGTSALTKKALATLEKNN